MLNWTMVLEVTLRAQILPSKKPVRAQIPLKTTLRAQKQHPDK